MELRMKSESKSGKISSWLTLISSLGKKRKEKLCLSLFFSYKKRKPWTTRAARSPRSPQPTSTRGSATQSPSGASNNKLLPEERGRCSQRPMRRHRRRRRQTPPVASEWCLPREGLLLVLLEDRHPRRRRRPRETGGECGEKEGDSLLLSTPTTTATVEREPNAKIETTEENAPFCCILPLLLPFSLKEQGDIELFL